MSEQRLPYGLEPIPEEVQAQYTNITWEKLIKQINDYLPKGWVAGWDFTGGGCSAIIINQKDDMNADYKSHIRVTDIDVPSVSDYQKEVDINFFTLGIHNAGNPSENWWGEDGKFHMLVVQGYEGSEYDFLDYVKTLIQDCEDHNLFMLKCHILNTIQFIDTETVRTS